MRQWGSSFASNIGIMLAGRASEYGYEQFMHRVFHRNEITGFERFSAGMAPIAATVGYQLICGAPRLHTFAHVPIGMLSIAPIDMALSSSETMLGVDQNSIWTQGANLLITSALAAAAPLATVNGISSATLASTRFWVSSGMSIGTGVAVAASLYAAAFIGHNIIDPLLARPAEFIASIFMSRSSMAYICNNDGTLSDVLAAIAHQIIV